MSKIIHTELITNNPKATADFVGKLLGWKVEKMNTPGMEYYTWNYPGEKMGGGGIGKISDEQRQQEPHINIFVDVDNIANAVEKAKSLGATLITEEMEIPNDMGYFAVIQIPGGCNLGLWSKQPSTQTKPQHTMSQQK